MLNVGWADQLYMMLCPWFLILKVHSFIQLTLSWLLLSLPSADMPNAIVNDLLLFLIMCPSVSVYVYVIVCACRSLKGALDPLELEL